MTMGGRGLSRLRELTPETDEWRADVVGEVLPDLRRVGTPSWGESTSEVRCSGENSGCFCSAEALSGKRENHSLLGATPKSPLWK